MAFLSWHERYRTGNAELDAQHEKLFEIVNHFDDVIQMGLTAELGLIMDDLIATAIAHFNYEEKLLEQIGFPEAAGHRKMHGELIVQVQDMRFKLKAGGHVGTKALVRFMADWLTYHIMREDMAYKPYLKG